MTLQTKEKIFTIFTIDQADSGLVTRIYKRILNYQQKNQAQQ